MTFEEFVSHFQGVTWNRTRDRAMGTCPAHKDDKSSLSLARSNGKFLLHCFAGCAVEEILAVVGLKMSDLFADGGSKPQVKIVATYDYTDADGKLVYQVVRYEPKSFRQRRPDGRGGWIWNLKGVRRVLYRLPEALGTKKIFITEGEKDVETARAMGLVATCNPSGAGKWCPDYSEALRGKQVFIIADADEAGRKYAEEVAASLAGKAASLKVVELPAAKDLSEWVERGGTRDELPKLIEQAPEWQPPTDKREREDAERRKPKITAQDGGRESQATAVVKLIEHMIDSGDVELFHTPGGKPFARLRVSNHWENWPLKSTGFETWLARLSFEAMGKAPTRETIKSVLAVLTGRALFAAEEVPTYVRVAERDGSICVDLCDASWRAVQITPTGWCTVSDPAVRFRRTRGMLPLPEPVSGGDPQELLQFVNIRNRASQVLFLSWIVAAFRPRGPYPILALHGGQGSAKTTCGAVARKLIDPSEVTLRTGPRDERDLMIAATNAHVIGYDNISSIPHWLSDAVCRVASGGGLGTRQLYTDEEETIFSVQRPIMFNGIEELMSRGDLLDRMLIMHLPPIPESKRFPETQFWRAFEEARPRLLGALLTVVAAALKQLPSVKLATLPRMADFAIWSVAAEQALGFRPGEFLRAYTENRVEANQVAVESSPVALEILALVNDIDRDWQGTAGEVLAELTNRVPEELRRDRSWPKTPKAMSNALARVSPNLSAMGVIIERLPREPGTGRRPYKICMAQSQPSQTVTGMSFQPVSRDGQCDGTSGIVTGSSPYNPGVPNACDGCDGDDAQIPTLLDGLDLVSGEEEI